MRCPRERGIPSVMSQKYKTAPTSSTYRRIMQTQNTAAADGQHTRQGIPHGSTSLTPHIVVTGGEAAIAFYRDALGARVVDVTKFGDVVAHAVLDFGSGMLTLSDPIDDYGLVALDSSRGHAYSLALYCADVDGVTEEARRAGAEIREEPTTFVSGDRFSSLVDPFGIRWSIMTRVEDLSPDESAARIAEWAAQQM